MNTIAYKKIGIIGFTVFVVSLVWAASRPWLASPLQWDGISTILWPSLALIVASATVAISWMLLERTVERVAVILASWATFILFWSPDIWYLTALPVFGLLWLESSRRVANDVGDRRRLRISTSVGAGLSPLLLGMFLMVSFGFYLLPSNKNVGASDVSIGIQKQLESVYDQPMVERQLSQFPAAMQSQVKRDIAKVVDENVQRFVGPLGPFIPPMLAFGLFLILWSVMFIFRELSIWMGVAIFSILKAVGFVRVGTKDVQAQIIEL